MSDPLDQFHERDRLQPRGDLSAISTGVLDAADVDDQDSEPARGAPAGPDLGDDPDAADPPAGAGSDDGREHLGTEGGTHGDIGFNPGTDGGDANDPDVDNAVEADSVQTLEAGNPPG